MMYVFKYSRLEARNKKFVYFISTIHHKTGHVSASSQFWLHLDQRGHGVAHKDTNVRSIALQAQTELGDLQGTIQLVISTDGQNSFAKFVYANPVGIFDNVANPDVEEDTEIKLEAVIGFDGGERSSGADFGQYLLKSNKSLQAVHTFRIDGNVQWYSECPLIWTPEMRPAKYPGHFKVCFLVQIHP